jgi:mono/diheme cytochrome c family protein
MRTAIAAAVVVLALAIAAAALLYSGAYNVAADEPHWPSTERILAALRERSIETRARELAAPDLGDPKRVVAGAGQYAEMCESCHLAPGVADTELRKGLYPKPPELARRAPGDARESFWIVKHGVKMTGMPAWGPTHDDETLWNIVAFLQALPGMDEKRYRELVGKSAPHPHSHGAKPHIH